MTIFKGITIMTIVSNLTELNLLLYATQNIKIPFINQSNLKTLFTTIFKIIILQILILIYDKTLIFKLYTQISEHIFKLFNVLPEFL